MNDIARLQSPLGHMFGDPALLETALTHRSGGTSNNERLEFLGDAILGSIVAAELFRRCPQAAESRLTVMRAALVRRSALAVVGRRLALGDYLRVGIGERKGGVVRRDSVLADAVEALLGAVFIDAGDEAARAFVARHFGDAIDEVIAAGAIKDAKTQLQEFQQARAQPLPAYATVARDGDHGNFRYRVECRIAGDDHMGTGTDGDVRAAEQLAAADLLAQLQAPTICHARSDDAHV